MRVLVDTHAFMWWDSHLGKLSATALQCLQNPQNQLLLSVASAWEIQLKVQLGKLGIQKPLPMLINSQLASNQFQLLGITLDHVLALDRLPLTHKDPFDRIIAAQALVENATVLTSDKAFASFPVATLW